MVSRALIFVWILLISSWVQAEEKLEIPVTVNIFVQTVGVQEGKLPVVTSTKRMVQPNYFNLTLKKRGKGNYFCGVYRLETKSTDEYTEFLEINVHRLPTTNIIEWKLNLVRYKEEVPWPVGNYLMGGLSHFETKLPNSYVKYPGPLVEPISVEDGVVRYRRFMVTFSPLPPRSEYPHLPKMNLVRVGCGS